MPQILLEVTDNVIEKEMSSLLFNIHTVLEAQLPTELNNCKSRIVRIKDYYVGNGDQNNAFASLTIGVLKGRTLELLNSIGTVLLNIMKDFLVHSLTQLNLQITVAIYEISEVYKRYTTA